MVAQAEQLRQRGAAGERGKLAGHVRGGGALHRARGRPDVALLGTACVATVSGEQCKRQWLRCAVQRQGHSTKHAAQLSTTKQLSSAPPSSSAQHRQAAQLSTTKQLSSAPPSSSAQHHQAAQVSHHQAARTSRMKRSSTPLSAIHWLPLPASPAVTSMYISAAFSLQREGGQWESKAIRGGLSGGDCTQQCIKTKHVP